MFNLMYVNIQTFYSFRIFLLISCDYNLDEDNLSINCLPVHNYSFDLNYTPFQKKKKKKEEEISTIDDQFDPFKFIQSRSLSLIKSY